MLLAKIGRYWRNVRALLWLFVGAFYLPICSLLQVFAINNQFPGPIINVTEGDAVVVRVTNMVPRDSISLHFHGLSMRGHPEMDGAAGFTQVC